ncbi:hypothetical protein [Bacterioplanoides sp.]|uniref:hypothetical protein n=1 Tax=Bacterioplanoides sp. TaxID=2066072 RepID=UPI003BAD5A90
MNYDKGGLLTAIDSVNQDAIQLLIEGAYELGGETPNTPLSGVGPLSPPSSQEFIINEALDNVKSSD